MDNSQLKGLFSAVTILACCAMVVSTGPADLLQRDCRDCRVLEELSCQKPGPTLGQFLQDILNSGVPVYNQLSTAIPSPQNLTPKLANSLQAIRTQSDNFFYVTLPEAVKILTTNSTLTPDQIKQVNNIVSNRIVQLAAVDCLIVDLAPKFNFSCAQKQTVIEIAGSGKDLFGAILAIVSDPNVQPTITPAQAEEIRKLNEKNDQLLSQALITFNVQNIPPPSCTVSPTFGKLVKDILDQGVNAYNKLRPVAGNAPTDKLTPTELDELQAILTQSQNFYKDLLPCVVDKLNSNTPLTPEQLQQVKDVLSQRVTMLTAVKYLIGNVGPKLGYNCVQQKTVIEISTVGIDLYGELLGVVQNTSTQPSLTPAQLAQINKLIADSDAAFNAAFVAFNVGPTGATVPTTVTTTTTTTQAPQVCYRN